jgi:pyridoxal phosphate enzyme (YggS family)
MGAISAALQVCRDRIAAACAASGRGLDCAHLLAVSKTFPADAIREAHAAGQFSFGESYVQEALPKIAALADLALEWHFIGPVQSNKTRSIAEHFHWVHGIDREKVALRLSEQRPGHLPALNVCIQVNVSGEASKSGVSPEEAPALAKRVANLPGLRLRGFMAIPEPTVDVALQRRRFRITTGLLEQVQRMGLPLDTLSMGMSADLEAAILEGATIVRVGTAIFGARDYPTNIREQAS